MLPDIAAEQRRRAVNERILAIRRLHDFQLAALVGEPAPARAELALAGLDERLAEFVEATEIAVDARCKRAGQLLAAAAGDHPFPEMDVVVMLAGIVEQRLVLTEGAFDDLLQALAFKAGAGEQ